LTCKKPQDKIQ